MLKNSRSLKWLLAILVLGTGIRLAWIYYVNTQPISDFKHYHDLALSLLHNGTYTMPEGLDYIKESTPFIKQGVSYPSAFRPPGYPFFLVLVYSLDPSILAAKIANVLLSLVWIVCAYLLVRRYFNERTGLWAALLTAVFPPAVSYTSLLSTEILAVTLILVILCFFAYRTGGRWNPLLLGTFMGMLSLVKPQYAVFPALYACMLWWERRGQRLQQKRSAGAQGWTERRKGLWSRIFSISVPVIYAGVFMALVISPWTLRNYLVFHRFVPISTNGNFVLYINNNDLNKGMYMDPMKVPHSIFKTDRILDEKGEYNEVDAMQLARQEAVRWITTHPRDAFLLGLDRLAVSYFNVGREIEEWTMSNAEIRFDQVWVQPLMQGARAAAWVVVGGGLLYSLILLFLFLRRRPLNVLHKINLLFIVFSTLVIFATEGQARYVFVIDPFFLIGVSWMIERLTQAITHEGEEV
ncbi:membrane protein [Collibacillus ludicampi]|uniref:Membrane protein n=1 Tax=Collibacillus ludicampi TaxID=2771369 RepID=A0AAV4LCV2_9BACL|nr:glycosyltransferase family 39 protein [Collibacillus ludicampi]GIM45621.1 membrane protein [Collibacillus ludicampi]